MTSSTAASAHGSASGDEAAVTGTVLEGVGGTYRIALDNGSLIEAVLRGRLKQERNAPPHQLRSGGVARSRLPHRVVAGDRVVVTPEEGETTVVEEVLPRRSELVRSAPGGRGQKIIAANVDQVAVVVALHRPVLRPDLLDRFLLLAELCNLGSLVVLNKTDLASNPSEADEAVSSLRERYSEAGYPVIATSTETGEGLPGLVEALTARVTVLAGPSGVGKSTLLNAIAPGLSLRTGEVSRRRGSGRHTTVSARLLPLPFGGWVVDTPGFSDLGLDGVDPHDLAQAFPEMRALAPECRFRRCSHTHEPGCAVTEAEGRGDLHPGRLETYRSLRSGLES